VRHDRDEDSKSAGSDLVKLQLWLANSFVVASHPLAMSKFHLLIIEFTSPTVDGGTLRTILGSDEPR
jgi:hypothetical protein